MGLITDILYVTYARDAEWFRHSLRVLEKNLTGYRRIKVVCPAQDVNLISSITKETQAEVYPIPDWPRHGYHWQQWVKMHADTYTDADLIFHIDSDAFVGKPTDVEDFFTEGRPSWLWSFYSDFNGEVPWKAPTERATGLPCDQEFMQAFPFIIHRSTYATAREWMERTHGIPHEQYIREAATRGHNSFSEFNVMGRIAWEVEHEKYAWIDRNRDKDGTLTTAHWPKGFYASRQFWSRAPLNDHLPEIQQMLTGGSEQHIRTTDRGIYVLSNDTHISKWVEQVGKLDFDGHLIPKILKYIKPGDVVVDVGAFIGDHTEAYAKATRGVDSGRVLAFEPNPLPFQCLTRNMQGHGHVTCIPKGLGSVPGKMGMLRDPNAGASYLVEGDEVEITTLDSYELPSCALIKVDAEGFEMSILMGAYRTIARCRPVIVLEMNAGALARNGVLQEDIYNWLRLRGYQINGHVENSPQFDVTCIPL